MGDDDKPRKKKDEHAYGRDEDIGRKKRRTKRKR